MSILKTGFSDTLTSLQILTLPLIFFTTTMGCCPHIKAFTSINIYHLVLVVLQRITERVTQNVLSTADYLDDITITSKTETRRHYIHIWKNLLQFLHVSHSPIVNTGLHRTDPMVLIDPKPGVLTYVTELYDYPMVQH